MWTRRSFVGKSLRVGAAAAPLCFGSLGRLALGQMSTSSYKAIVVITLGGGNDANNMIVPLDPAEYSQYSSIRSTLSVPVSALLPLPGSAGSLTYGLHPMLPRVAGLFTQKRAAVIANVGPLAQPVIKQQLLTNIASRPQTLQSHSAGQQQWESATTVASPVTGWGGRIADVLSAQSGLLPPVLNTAQNSIFTVGQTVQGIVLQGGGAFAAIPADLNAVILQMAEGAAKSTNHLVSQVAAFRATSMQQQVLVNQALQYAPIRQIFPPSPLGRSMQTIARLLAGRSVISASRQIFYTQQFGYDTHHDQLKGQAQLFSDFDTNLGLFFDALDDLGLSDQVLVCTHSDFGRTMTGNSLGGSDHAWGNHQLILGGGIQGGRVIGTMPTLDLGGSDDLSTTGIWIPTLSVTQLAAAMGSWMGLTAAQLAQIFPDLTNFQEGPIKLT